MKYFQATLFFVLVFALSYFTPRTDFIHLFGSYTLLFALFLWVYIRSNETSDIIFFSLVGIASRLICVFAFPFLSDDIYRFFWDGALFNQGINPFSSLPSQIVGTTQIGDYLKHSIYPLLNSPDYFTIYPPISQLIYSAGALVFPTDVAKASYVLGSFLLLAECGSIYLIYKLLPIAGIHQKHTLTYALNPLIIIETCGNLHFEGLMIFFFLASYWFIHRKNYLLFALCFAASILTKLFTLCLYPLFFKTLGVRRFVGLGVLISAVCIASFIPFINQEFVSNFLSSLDLYMRKFEFNASFYYLLRALGRSITGYNEIAKIGPILALLFILSTLLLYVLQYLNDRGLMYRSMLIWTIYLLFSTIVHPWYLIGIITFSAFTNFKYPIVWSYLIYLSYSTYGTTPYKENMAILFTEYAILLIFMLIDFGILFPSLKKKLLA